MQFIYMMYKHEQVQNVIIKHYQIQNQIGEGVSARVYKAYRRKDNTRYAIKVIPKEYLASNPKLYDLVKNEIEILRSCDNENIIKFYDVFQTASSVLIVTQLCNGRDMEQYLKGKFPLSEDTAVLYLKQIINGFRGLHDAGVMHRDFKLANILVHDQVCKIADLGYAKKMEGRELTHTFLGTRITMAPEVLQRTGYSYTADIWSLGVVFYQMLFGTYPYQGANQFQLLKNIRQKQVAYDSRRISHQAQQFIKKCLQPNPKSRMSWNQVYTHPLIEKKHFQILLSVYNPIPALHKNQEFYKNNKNMQCIWEQDSSQNQGMPSLLQHSIRKKLIIEQINNIVSNKMEKMSEETREQELLTLLYKYAKQYLHYFNKLASCFKFLRLSLIEHRSDEINKFMGKTLGRMKAINLGTNIKLMEDNENTVQLESLVYLACKKSYMEVLQYWKLVRSRVNIFKIRKYWSQFAHSELYKQMESTIGYNVQKIDKIIKELSEYACLSRCQDISMDACNQNYQNMDFNKIWQKYLKKGAMRMVQFYKEDEGEDKQLGEFMEGLLYYLVNDEANKLSPEQFDHQLGEPLALNRHRQDLIERYQVYFYHM